MVVLAALLFVAYALNPISSHQNPRVVGELPTEFDASSMEQGSVVPEKAEVVAESADYTVWTADDLAGERCLLVQSAGSNAVNAGCSPVAVLDRQGTAVSLNIPGKREALHAYLLPDGVNGQAAAKQIPGSEVCGQVLVRLGNFHAEKS